MPTQHPRSFLATFSLTSDGDALEGDRVADHVGSHGAEGLLPALAVDDWLLRGR